MRLTMVVDFPAKGSKKDLVVEDDLAQEQGFASQRELLAAWLLALRNESLHKDMILEANELWDERGNLVRRGYCALVTARWMDGMGNTVLGTSNGDEIIIATTGE